MRSMQFFGIGIQPVTQLRQQFSGSFDRLIEDNDDLRQFANCSNASAWLCLSLSFYTL